MDPAAYDPDMYRCCGPQGAYGPATVSLEVWTWQQARLLWGRARRAWHDEHGGVLVDDGWADHAAAAAA